MTVNAKMVGAQNDLTARTSVLAGNLHWT